jgi:hypothetical protein
VAGCKQHVHVARPHADVAQHIRCIRRQHTNNTLRDLLLACRDYKLWRMGSLMNCCCSTGLLANWHGTNRPHPSQQRPYFKPRTRNEV